MSFSRKMRSALFSLCTVWILAVYSVNVEAKYYTVVKGDTIYGISRKTGVSVKEILKLNDVGDPKKLYVGKKIILPDNSAASVSAKKTSSKESVSFKWPARNIRHIEKDGEDGVHSIGIYIFSTNGAYVLTSAAGVVSKIGYVRGYGNYVVVSHFSRYMTVYSNLGSIYVKTGQKIAGGKAVGKLGEKNSRFHFQINLAGKPQDAVKILPKL